MVRSVWFATLLRNSADNPYVYQVVESLKQMLLNPPDSRKSQYSRYYLAKSPDDADIILFVEDYKYKTRDYVVNLLDDPLIQYYPDRCFAFDWQPEPPGLLPGVYVSMPRRRMDPSRFRPGSYIQMYNPWPQRLWEDAKEQEPRLLFSFRGNINPHSVRRSIIDANFCGEDVAITVTDKWYDHDEQDKEVYAREICDSKFILCPRGIATSSYRMYETMALGRVPVILSDEWVPPAGVAWNECALWVAENRVAELPTLIRQYEPYWRVMGQNARSAWEAMFSPEIALYWTLRSIEEIALFRGADRDERTARSRWASWSFAWQNGWTLPQKVYGALENGTAGERIRRKLQRVISYPNRSTN